MTQIERMTHAEPPRLMTDAETARLLRMTPTAFARKRAQLEALGFPPRHPVLKRRDRVAINQWLNDVFGIRDKATNISDLVRRRMGELHGGDGAH